MKLEYEWSLGAEVQLRQAQLAQRSFEALMQLEHEIDRVIDQITDHPESARQQPDFERFDIRVIPVLDYRMTYMVLQNRIVILAFKPGRSGSALD